MRVLVELHNKNWNGELHLLLQKMNRIWRPRDKGWNQTRPSLRRRYSRIHWSSRDNRLQPVHRDGVGFIPYLENKKISESR